MIDQQENKGRFSRGTNFTDFYKHPTLSVMVVLGLSMSACAQNLEMVKAPNQHHQVYEWEDAKPNTHKLAFKDSFTSVYFEVDGNQSFKGVHVIEGEDTIPVKEATHLKTDGKQKRSEPVIFQKRTNRFDIIKGDLEGSIEIHLLDAGGKSFKERHYKKETKSNCNRPNMVPQSDWREGLTDPSNQPIQHNVEHAIVHHSAGSNNNPNTRDVVRNIYLFHTNTNGWSDIGYNFLIGINGKIYEGRDGKGMVKDSDVKGAHFCGKNSNTMGVGIIGTYNDTVPSDSAINSLKRILGWKLHEEQLNPLGTKLHPQSGNDQKNLGIIAGHRDGCATECPGDNLYNQLGAIKQDVSDSVNNCGLTVGRGKGIKRNALTVGYQNGHMVLENKTVSGKGKFTIYNAKGQQIKNRALIELQAETNKTLQERLSSGVYIAKITLENGGVYTKRFVVFE